MSVSSDRESITAASESACRTKAPYNRINFDMSSSGTQTRQRDSLELGVEELPDDETDPSYETAVLDYVDRAIVFLEDNLDFVLKNVERDD